MQLRVLLTLIAWGLAEADWFDSCDREFQLTSVADVTLNSPFYPANYPPGSSCRFVVRAPEGYVIQATCTVSMPGAGSCSTDFLYVSTEGFMSPVGSEFFCGRGSVARRSLLNKLTISYISAGSTDSGSFTCRLVVQQASCDCGWSRTAKIVGGVEAAVNEFTSMVGLLDPATANVFCSGVIVSSRYILSAAHCVQPVPDVSRVSALVGDHDYRNGLETPYSAIYNIEQIIVHEGYAELTRDNDVSLLRTASGIDWNRAVGPVCLPILYETYSFVGLSVDLAGWGTTSFGGPMSTVLRKATVQVLANTDCSAPYLNDLKLCTFAAGRDSCQYDSGGPLYLRGAQRMYTIGIISYGSACGGTTPSVNTRVTNQLNWIRRQTPDTVYCAK